MKDKLKEQLIDHEGLRLKPYMCTAGKLSIGVGRNLDDNGITKDEALYLLDNDIENALSDCQTLIQGFNAIDDVRKIALIDMMFNLGYNRMSKFIKMLTAIKCGDWEEASKQALDSRWAKQVGRRAEKIAEQLHKGV